MKKQLNQTMKPARQQPQQASLQMKKQSNKK